MSVKRVGKMGGKRKNDLKWRKGVVQKTILPVPRWVPVEKFEKLNEEGRAHVIEQALYLIWDSLHSHLPHTYGKGKKKTKSFEKRCVEEYATLIYLVSRLY